MHGANGEPLVLKVPLGTIVKDQHTGEILADLDQENTRFLVAK